MGNRVIWALLFLTGCGSTAGNTPSSVQPGAAGKGGSGGNGFNPIGSGAGSGGSGGAGTSSAGNTSAAGATALPSNATVLGPYPFSGGYGASGMDWSFNLSLPGDGLAFFSAQGTLQLNQPTTVVTGLLRAPSGSAISTDWICPGPSATWVPTQTDDSADCSPSASRCSYNLVMPTPSQLSCAGASTRGALSFSAVAPDGSSLSTAASSLSTLDGRLFYLGSAAILTLDPAPVSPSPMGVSFQESVGGPTSQSVQVLFHAEAVVPSPGSPVTQWTLSAASVIYHPMGLMGPTDLLCATGGTYQISSTTPIQHSVSLRGVSDPVVCPGKATATPLVLQIGN